MTELAIVIPALNAARHLPECLKALAGAWPVLLVDGGSDDATREIARAAGASVLQSVRGRGQQLAAGAAASRSEWILFLHADTVLETGWQIEARQFMADTANNQRAAAFRFALDDASGAARRLEKVVAWRCRRLGVPYGDQGLLLSRNFYDAIGGFRPQPIMEDVDIVRRIGRRNLVMLEARAMTSAERWLRDGWLRRCLRNAACMTLYLAGAPLPLIDKAYGMGARG